MQTIAVIGTGKLGLCFALNLARKGYQVLGVDNRPEHVAAIRNRSYRSSEPGLENLLNESHNFSISDELGDIVNKDIRIVFLCVATPSLPDNRFDHSQILQVGAALRALPKPAQLTELVVVATTMPGFCDTFQQEMSGWNYRVSYNPEFIAQGSILHDQLFPDQVLIGEADTEAGDRIESLYRSLCENEPVYCRMSRLEAEITKLATNCFLTTKITFANTLGDLAVKAGANPDVILRAIGSDSRIGKAYLRYGYGFGGPCFPRDNQALLKFAEQIQVPLPLSPATIAGNNVHLQFQFEQLMAQEGPIVFDSITYKKGTNILEESQQYALALRLAAAGREVQVRAAAEVREQVEAEHPGLFTWLPV